MNIAKIWDNWIDAEHFSGVFSVADENGVVFQTCGGCRNRSENLPNNRKTAFGIASGTKLFTGLAVCKLIDAGKLSLHDQLWDILPYDLGVIDKRVTVFHLLTHTSGIGDYIDEESPDSAEQMRVLYDRYPVYLWERLAYYLPMITPLPPKFVPGTRFSYSNAGFVMLGLVIEAASGVTYQDFVADQIIRPLELEHTGFYRMDALPANTALGYTTASGQSSTNIFSLPVLGGADGGLYTCAEDLDTLWRAIFSDRVLSEDVRNTFIKPHVVRREENSYGLGIYLYGHGEDTVYYALGGDFGVDFFTAFFPRRKMTASALGNTELNTYPLLDALFSQLRE